MLLAEFHKTNKQTDTLPSSNYNWKLDSMKYTAQQIGEMPSWIAQMKENFEQPLTQSKEIDTNSFSEMQKLAFNMLPSTLKTLKNLYFLSLMVKQELGRAI